jgi:hypothetical protein
LSLCVDQGHCRNNSDREQRHQALENHRTLY